MSDLKSKFLYQLLLAFSQLLFPLMTYPWLTRTLGPEGLGKTGYIEFTAGLIFTLFSLGISYYGVREVAKERNNPERRSALTGELVSLHLLSVLIGILFYAGILLLNKNFSNEKELMMLGALIILAQVFAMEWYLQGLEKFRFITLRSIFIRIAGMVAIFLLVRKKEDYVLYYGIVVATQIVVSVAAIMYVVSENNIRLFRTSFRKHLKPLFIFFLTTTFISVYVYFDTVILGFFTDDKTVGYYTAGIKIVKLPLLLLLTFNTILFPRISFLTAENRPGEIRHLHKISAEYIFTFTVPVSVLMFVLAPEITLLVAGPAFGPSVDVIRILSALPFFISTTIFLTSQVLIPDNRERKIMAAVFAGSICSLLLLFLLIPVIKERGAAVATLATEFVVMALCLFFSWRLIKEVISPKLVVTSFLFSLVVIPVTLLARAYSSSSLVIFLSVTAVSGLTYLFLQYFAGNNSIIKEGVRLIKKPFRN